MDMAADVRVFFVILSFLMLIKPSQSSDQGNPLGDIMGVLGALGDAAGTGNKCKYQCPNGVKPKANPRHKPSTNGCGSYGIELDTTEFPVLTECCNKHDMCYDTCGSERSDCDDIFKKCVKKSCKQMRTTGTINRQQYDECLALDTLMPYLVDMLGCDAFIVSQENVCICPSSRPENEEGQDWEGQIEEGQIEKGQDGEGQTREGEEDNDLEKLLSDIRHFLEMDKEQPAEVTTPDYEKELEVYARSHGCQSMANLLHSATSLLGCNTFLESQKNACICQRHSDEL